MAEYKDYNGEQYCQKSNYASNVKEMNQKMGYHNLSDPANISKMPQKMHAKKVNTQIGANLPKK